MMHQSTVDLHSHITTRKIPGVPLALPTLKSMLYHAMPNKTLSLQAYKWRQQNCRHLLSEIWRLYLMTCAGRITGYPFLRGSLWLHKVSYEQLAPHKHTLMKDFYGLACLRLVTNAGRDEVVDEFDGATAAGFDLTTFNFHGIGTGATAPAVGDTALQAELTTEYTANVRATGVQSQPTSDVYRTVGINTLDSGTPAITEAGVLSQAATGGGILLERFTFAAINLVGTSGDGLQTTVNLTLNSGG